MKLANMNDAELTALQMAAKQAYEFFKQQGLKLNMARGKPSQAQAEMVSDLYKELDNYQDANGEDVRNYGSLTGVPEARQLFAEILDAPASQVVVCGSSSLNLMYDVVCRAYVHGVLPEHAPWRTLEKVKFLCPSPGYDRHFTITDSFHIENIPVPMTENGPDMDVVESLVASDPSIKGIWCVPMYSNPDGVTYSDETVRRFASLKPAAADFRIFWDDAYAVHHLYAEESCHDHLLPLYAECVKKGTEDMLYLFTSFSKVTIASGGISAFAMSPRNLEWHLKLLSIQSIGYDRVNQLRHVRYLPNRAAVETLMLRHADILRPKFEMVLSMLEQEIAPLELASWHAPRGGYFVSFFAPKGTAKRIISLCQEAGVVLTGAGATYPGQKDSDDSNIRIAPTYPPVEELRAAMEVFCAAVKLAAAEKALSEK